MVDLSKPWPLGLGDRLWWRAVLGAIVVLAVALAFDRQLSRDAQAWPEPIRGALAEITPYGQLDWILFPAGALFVITAALAVIVRWRLMRLMLWQFAGLYAFIFIGVGLPGVITALVKRLVGRGRPMHFDESGAFSLHANWFDWSYQSFPSAHSTTAFALATVVGLISPRWFYPALAMAAVIGISRVALGAHYPSDVVAGAIVGLVGAYVVRWLFAAWGHVFRRRDGRITMRDLSSLKRYLALKRRGSARAQQPGRP